MEIAPYYWLINYNNLLNFFLLHQKCYFFIFRIWGARKFRGVSNLRLIGIEWRSPAHIEIFVLLSLRVTQLNDSSMFKWNNRSLTKIIQLLLIWFVDENWKTAWFWETERRQHAFNIPFCRTNRQMNSFIMHTDAAICW